MIVEDAGRCGSIHKLTKGPFVDNTRISRIVKNRRCDPGLGADEDRLEMSRIFAHLENEPTTQVDTPHFLTAVGKAGVDGGTERQRNEADNRDEESA